MRPTVRKLLVFAAQFLLIFIVLTLAWPIFAPVYNVMTVGLANAFFPLVEEPDVSWLKAEGNSVAIYVRDPAKGPLLFGYLDYPHSGLVVFLALFLATPGLTWRRRFITIVSGLGLLVGIHAVSLIAKTRFEYVNAFGNELPIPDSVYLMYAWLGRLLVAVSLTAPFVVWALMTFRYWFPKPITSPLAPAPQPHKKHRPKEARP